MITPEIQALLDQQERILAEFNRQWDAERARNRVIEESLRETRNREYLNLQDALEQAYLKLTEGRGLQQGDVVTIYKDYGDAKKGEHAFVRETSKRDGTIYVTCDFHNGTMSLPLNYVYLELDQHKADFFRLSEAVHGMRYDEAPREQLQQVIDTAQRWLGRLG